LRLYRSYILFSKCARSDAARAIKCSRVIKKKILLITPPQQDNWLLRGRLSLDKEAFEITFEHGYRKGDQSKGSAVCIPYCEQDSRKWKWRGLAQPRSTKPTKGKSARSFS